MAVADVYHVRGKRILHNGLGDAVLPTAFRAPVSSGGGRTGASPGRDAMKRNEKILVYAVTGFLMVILGVAILFGNKERSARPDRTEETAGRGAVSLQDLLRERIEGGRKPASGEEGSELPGDSPGKTGSEARDRPGADEQVGQSSETGGEAGGKDVSGVPLVAQPQTPVEQVSARFGPSRRERDFRIVTVQSGDSFRALVQKWCGSVAEYVEAAERLNETVASRPLKPGQELVLPWVDEEVLLEAWQARSQGEPVAVETPAGEDVRLYTVQKGDSIWGIAAREVEARSVPAYIEKVKSLNPQINNLDLLRVGQELRLPPRQP